MSEDSLESRDKTNINGHEVVLRDPPGSPSKKFKCELCGKWDPSLTFFEKVNCESDESPETESAFCQCESPDIVRTLAKGTPAEKKYCSCGGRIND